MEEKVEMKEEMKTQAERVPDMAAPRIFMGADEKIVCEVNGFYDKETGFLEFVIPGAVARTAEQFNIVKHEFVFSRIPYDRLNTYRTQSMMYNHEDRTSSVNVLKLRDFFWVFHLVDWNFTDGEGVKIPLTRDPNQALSDESLAMLYRLPASVLDTAMGILERRINIA